jgi:hypothetical protein
MTIKTLGEPLTGTFINPALSDGTSIAGSYQLMSDLETGAAAQHAAKDLPNLTVNDMVFATRYNSEAVVPTPTKDTKDTKDPSSKPKK